MPPITCPRCGLLSSEVSDRCDCGYAFNPSAGQDRNTQPPLRARTIGGKTETFRVDSHLRVMILVRGAWLLGLGVCSIVLGVTRYSLSQSPYSSGQQTELQVWAGVAILAGLGLLWMAARRLRPLWYSVRLSPEAISWNGLTFRWHEITGVHVYADCLVLRRHDTKLTIPAATEAFDYIVDVVRETVPKAVKA